MSDFDTEFPLLWLLSLLLLLLAKAGFTIAVEDMRIAWNTNSHHNNPLCRVVPLEILQKVGEKEKGGNEENDKTLNYYDKDRYKEIILDAAETVLGYFGFDRTVYENPKNNRKKKKKWYDELQEERTKDIQAELLQ